MHSTDDYHVTIHLQYQDCHILPDPRLAAAGSYGQPVIWEQMESLYSKLALLY